MKQPSTRSDRRSSASRARKLCVALFGASLSAMLGAANAAALNRISQTSSADYKALPTTSVESAAPLVMLAMSNDEQLYVKAYTDYTDLDSDGVVDTTYQSAFSYSGYFDSALCYEYSSGQFQASAAASSGGRCLGPASGDWSGNFLNWLTMTRLDVVRTVLYGGLRKIDTATRTVLERAYVPSDVHAWVKVYRGNDVHLYTPYSYDPNNPVSFCNVSDTNTGSESGTSTRQPRLRVARGNFSEWATTEVSQCRWDSEGPSRPQDTPNTGSISPDQLNVVVEVCGSNPALRESFCRPYVDGANTRYKPAGLLQRYGESGDIRFGLITGSYSKPRSGGQLRKNIGLLANVDNDATLSCETGDEINLLTGQFCNQSGGTEGIINTLNRFRTYRWNASSSRHEDCNTFNILNREEISSGKILNNPGSSSSANRVCNSWGNPLSEIYAEAVRYFSDPGGGPTADFMGTEPNLVPHSSGSAGAVPTASWSDPFTPQTYCADCSIVVISTGLNSFDTDELPSVAAASGNIDINGATNAVGANEGVNGTNVAIGRVGTTPLGVSLNTHEDVCSSKNLTSLSLARGICPEIPSYEGGYQIAGLAYGAHVADLRNDLPQDQTIRTYSIALAEALPSFQIAVGSGEVTIVPACQAKRGGATLTDNTEWSNCALANIAVGEKPSTSGYTFGRPLEADGSAGSFFIAWEDSAWGNDRDLDITTMITYCVGSQCNRDVDGNPGPDICYLSDSTANCNTSGNLVTPVGAGEMLVRVEITSAVAGNHLAGGYTISGATANNGFQRKVLRPSGQNSNLLTGGSPGGSWTAPQVDRFSPGPSSVSVLSNPLLYAAKYGAFDDLVPDGRPTMANPEEWDQVNNFTGLDGADGLPDSYFPVRNPAQLAERLADVFNDIIRRAGSGTAAAVVANAREGEGAIYQALFDPSRIDGAREANWIGTLHSLWLDSQGRLREDDGDAVLEEADFGADPVIEIYFDQAARITRFRRFSGDPSTTTPVENLAIEDINSLWNAREQLSSLTNASLANNRIYSASAATGRYILTFLDYDQDGVPDANEVQPFESSTFSSNASNGNFGILNAPTLNEAQDVVQYIRGQEIAGLRNRTINYDGDAAGTDETLRLGDIVQSTPVAVGAPAEALDLIYNDETYENFRRLYRNRRTVVYVGANDGLLHAFNGGFFSSGASAFQTTPPAGSPAPPAGTATAHPLGSELWAFAPHNLLPHLTWLTEEDYPHVWYMDGKPRVFDARIFPADSEHPHGWGTVLVVGMRLGGGELTLSRPTSAGTNRPVMDADDYRDSLSAFGATDGTFEMTTRSAYLVLDVTNPEVPPKLIAELSAPGMGFTTSFPTALSVGQTGNTPSTTPSVDEWYLIFGNGPTNADGSPGGNPAGVYLYDLHYTSRGPVTNWYPQQFTTLAPNSFVGDPVSVDWDLDFKADAVYVGTIGGSIASGDGKLMKIDIEVAGDTDISTNEARPVASWVPSVLANPERPVVATPAVTQSNAGSRWVFSGTGRFFANDDKPTSQNQFLFGVIDGPSENLDAMGDPERTAVNSIVSSYTNVSSAVVLTDGSVSGVGGVSTEQELVDAVDIAGGWRLDLPVPASSERSVNSMAILSEIVFASTFTPSSDLCLGEGSSRLFGLYFKTGAARSGTPVFGTDAVNTLEVVRDLDLGAGLSASPSLSIGGARDSRGLTIFTQTSTGAIERREGELPPGSSSGETDWRERYQ